MTIQKKWVKLLSDLIVEEIKANFSTIYVSHNLVDTIQVVNNNQGGVDIKIPAQIYDMDSWNKSKVLVYKEGSYASAVNENGGFSGYHKDFITKSIKKAVDKWRVVLASEGVDVVL